MSDLILGALGEQILYFLQGLQNVIFDLYFGVVTVLGDTLPILIIAVLLYYTVDKEFMTGLIYLLIFSRHLNIVTKIFFHNPRPCVYKPDQFLVTTHALGETVWHDPGDFSFPSGHSQTQGSIWSYVLPKIRNIPLFILGILFLVSIPLSRLYLGVHWPSDILIGVLFGGFISLVYMKGEGRYRPKINSWSDSRKIVVGILVSLGLIAFGLLSFYFGTIFTFNQSISMSDPIIWLETDLGSYPGLLVGVIIGQVLEKKHVNFNTDDKKLTKALLRIILGVISASVLYLGSKIISNIAEDIQTEILWITQVTNFLSFFVFGIIMAFIVPWLFTRIER